MDSTNERIETTDKLVLRIENWLKQVAENNNQSVNQTHILDQSLIELSNEVGTGAHNFGHFFKIGF